MHIKQVTIKGFKTYRDQTFVEPFSPHHNVIVGRNGSGKSNFFFAIRFVLSDMFSSLKQNDRQSLLHEGAGNIVVSAFVELVLDNEDGRLPSENKEVIIRRSISLKKDEYYLDNKRSNKVDINNLLESAGFSRSNPYYIVQQGKINSLALATDAQRLQLLKDIAGTTVFERSRREGLEEFTESKRKGKTIDELLDDINNRMEDLESEQAELQEYQVLDSEKRAIEYVIYSQELMTTNAKIDELEARRHDLAEAVRETDNSTGKLQDQIQELEARIERVRGESTALNAEKQQLHDERTEQIRAKANMELDVDDARTTAQTGSSRRGAIAQELEQLEADMTEVEAALSKLLPKHTAASSDLAQRQAELTSAELQRDALLDKQSRTVQYKTQAERDAFLKEEIASLTKTQKDKQAVVKQLTKDIAQRKQRLKEDEQDLAETEAKLAKRKPAIEEEHAKLNALTEQRHQLQNQRRDAHKQAADLSSKTVEVRERLQASQRELMGSTGRVVSQGIDSIKQLVDSGDYPGVYGPLIDLIEVDEQFLIAAETAAGNALFNVVVDTDVVASKLLAEMNRQKLPGRVTFLPLNKLKPKQHSYPKSADTLPLVERVQCEEHIKPAVQHVFARTIVCKDLEVAAKFAGEGQLDCLTMEGDKVNRRNVFSGGYVETGRLKLKVQRGIVACREELQALEDQGAKLQQQEQAVEQQMNVVMTDIHKADNRLKQLRSSMKTMQTEVQELSQKITSDKHQLQVKNDELQTLKTEVEGLTTQIAALKAEMTAEMHSQLDDDEHEQLKELTDKIEQAREQVHVCIQQRSELDQSKTELETRRDEFLRKRQADLNQELSQLDETDAAFELTAKEVELEELSATIEEGRKRMESIEAKVQANSTAAAKLAEELESLRNRFDKQGTSSQDVEAEMETLLSKRSSLLQKRDEYSAKMRGLGALSGELYQKHESTDLKTLYAKLKATGKRLKKYSHVNKKAFEQYRSFAEDRAELIRRKEIGDKDEGSIDDLIVTLDQRKVESITRTFKMVAHHFKAVFKQLVPHGHGELVMQTSRDAESQAAESQDDSEAGAAGTVAATYASFTGVSIKVNFTGRGEDTHFLNQLSGGQKSLVALALIFAIQRCDPAPFYLFDEIDQALDPAHRTAVAGMIFDSSREAQYITTTFRPEMLERCDKCYGVTFTNKVSKIQVVSRDQALEFISNEARDQ
eukprot:m.137533 g.137533  ORF g.137533 m.137533 type:complete len:1205 (-) comp16056_c0_seq1:67-3681(-)